MQKIRLNYIKLNEKFKEFKEFLLSETNIPFTSFQHQWIDETENYKKLVRLRARQNLELNKWKVEDIGTGKMITHLIAAIELKENNLLNWQGKHGPSSKSHISLIETKEKHNVREYEEVLFNFYKNRIPDEESFNEIIKLAGKQYPFLAYLFFIKDSRKYLPIAPKSFDRVFKILDIDFRTTKKCSWENYKTYISIILGVKDFLMEQDIHDVHLIDAHSFLWILSYKFCDEKEDTKFNTLPVEHIPCDMNDVEIPWSFESNKKEIDFIEVNKRKQIKGKMAEQKIYELEKQRLMINNRLDLSKRVKIVSDNYSLGYDILSFELDGRETQIEVKNVTYSNKLNSFYITHNELEKSKTLSNYYIYCVKNLDKNNEEIIFLRNPKLDDDNKYIIENVNYKIYFE